MSRVRLGVLVAAGVAVALALAFFVGPEASSKPDGLTKVAQDEGFASEEQAHDLDDSPVAGYEVEAIDDDRMSTGVAGILGVGVTFAIGSGLFLLVRRTRRGDDTGQPQRQQEVTT
jgi:hypothetical protein